MKLRGYSIALVALATFAVLSSCSTATSSSLSAPTVTYIISTPGDSTNGTSSSGSSNAQVTWAWPAESGAASYNLYYKAGSTVSTSTGTEISDITSTCSSSSGSGCPSGDYYYTVSGLSDSTEYAFVLTAVDSSGNETSASSVFTDTPPYFGSDVPDSPGSGSADAAVIDSDVPSWIANGFTNVRAYMDGSDVVIDTRDLPPYTSYYYRTSTGGTNSYTDTSTTPSYPDPNIIEQQAIRLVVPESPSYSSSTTKEFGLGIVGLSANGLVIFNGEADTVSGDYISDEEYSFDTKDGHAQSGGIYHYHTQPAPLTPTSGYDDELLGVAIDGFPIYGPQNSSGTDVVTYTSSPGNSSTNPLTPSNTSPGACSDISLANWKSNSADPTSSGLPHYRVVSSFYENTVKDTSDGPAHLPYMLGCYEDGQTAGSETDYTSWTSSVVQPGGF